MYRVLLISKMLRSVGYDAASRILEAEFTSGGVYRYFDVPATEHEALLHAESHGQYFNAHIRDGYRYTRVGVTRPVVGTPQPVSVNG